MGILQNPLGINLTNFDPLIDDPYDDGYGGFVPPPPESFFMITENGLFMLDEDGIELMITE